MYPKDPLEKAQRGAGITKWQSKDREGHTVVVDGGGSCCQMTISDIIFYWYLESNTFLAIAGF